jgi:chitodextrinase
VAGTVRSLLATPDGAAVYVGGQFTSIAGVARGNLALVSAITPTVLRFRADTNGEVRDLALYRGSLYAVGSFGRVNGTSRGRGAALDAVTGALASWNPRASSGIRAVDIDPVTNTAYVGGAFTSLSGDGRAFMGAVDATSGDVRPWLSGSTCQDSTNPCHVFDVALTADYVYVAIGGPGGRISALDRTSGAQRWWVGGDGDVQTVLVDGGKVIAGGHFVSGFGGVEPRAGVAYLDGRSGAVLPDFDASVVGQTGVWAMLLDGDQLRIGGHFETIDGATVRRYASFRTTPDPADGQLPSAPGTPRAPAALSDAVTLTWTAASDNVAVTEYRIRRNGIVVGTSSTTLFKDRTVSPATSYQYQVEAVDAAGNVGPLSGSRSVTTEAARARLVSTDTPWLFFSRGVDPVAGWNSDVVGPTTWAEGSGEFGFGDGDEDTYISPLGVAHYFRTAFTVENPAAISTPTLRLLVDDGAVAYLNGTELTRVNMPTGLVTNTTTATVNVGGTNEMIYTSYVIPPAVLRAGTNVLAVQVHNYSATWAPDISFAAVVEYQGLVVPPAPTGLAATADGQTKVNLSWTPSAGATGYTVSRDGSPVGATAQTSFVDIGLEAGTEYTYTVVATNANGPSAPCEPVVVTTDAAPSVPPSAPTGLVVGTVTAATAQLVWTPVPEATGYVVLRDGIAVGTPAPASFSDSGLSPSTQYSYAVRATNGAGPSAPSEAVIVTTPEAPPEPPDQPAELLASDVTSTSITVRWTAVPLADTYVVRRDGVEVGTRTSPSFRDTGLSVDTPYAYTVTAVNANGASTPSSPLAARTRTFVLSGDEWRVNDVGADLGAGWREPGYNDSAWRRGGTQIGYGDGDERTLLAWGPSSTAKLITYYARTSVDAGHSIGSIKSLQLRALVDDGAVVYLNGTEIWRFNLPDGPVGFTTRASRTIAGTEERQWRTVDVSASALLPGQNVIAVEVHQDSGASSDVSLDLELSPIR